MSCSRLVNAGLCQSVSLSVCLSVECLFKRQMSFENNRKEENKEELRSLHIAAVPFSSTKSQGFLKKPYAVKHIFNSTYIIYEQCQNITCII